MAFNIYDNHYNGTYDDLHADHIFLNVQILKTLPVLSISKNDLPSVSSIFHFSERIMNFMERYKKNELTSSVFSVFTSSLISSATKINSLTSSVSFACEFTAIFSASILLVASVFVTEICVFVTELCSFD